VVRRAALASTDASYLGTSHRQAGVKTVVRRVRAGLDLTVTFHTHLDSLAARLPVLFEHTVSNGMVWVAWPKQAAVKRLGLAADLGESYVRELGLGLGWVDVKIAAIDEVWSGLKFVRRLSDR